MRLAQLLIGCVLLALVAGYAISFDDDPLAPTPAPADEAYLPRRGNAAELAVLVEKGIADVAFSYDASGYVSGVGVTHLDGTLRQFGALVPPPPEPTDPPEPTATASRTPTNTPAPTITPIPTNTPRPTSTPVIEPSPTAEPPIPTVTPGPTIPPKVCSLRSAHPDGVSPINIRQGPTTTAAIVGRWYRGIELSFSEFVVTRDYLWGKTSAGYAVVYEYALSQWWTYGTNTSALCDEVNGWPKGMIPPVAFARGGPHILMGEGGSTPVNYSQNIGAAKCLDGSFQICLLMKQYNPSMFIIARHLEDRPSPWHYDHPRAWWDQIKNGLPPGFDAYEIENEAPPDRALYPKWVNFSIEMAKIVYQERNGILLAFSFGPGNPDYAEWPLLIPYLEWVAAHPTPDGRYHGIAWHASPYAPFNRVDMPWVNHPHIAGRELFVRQVILDHGGPDLRTWPGQFWVTEIGLGDGYSGSWKAPYTCQEAAAAYKETLRRYGSEGIIDGLTWWNFGKLGIWSSDHDCSAQMFVKLQ